MTQLHLFSELIKDKAIHSAASGILESIFFQFEETTTDESLDSMIHTTLDYLLEELPDLANTNIQKDVDGFNYTIGKDAFDFSILDSVCNELQGQWVVSIDESTVDEESFLGGVAYRHSCSFGFRIPTDQDTGEERLLAVSTMLRLQDEEDFDRKMMFISYIMNMYVAIYTQKIINEQFNDPIAAIFLHGPLVRQIGPFTNLLFKRELIEKALTAETSLPDEFGVNENVKRIASGGLCDEMLDDPCYSRFVGRFLNLFNDQATKKLIQQRIEHNDEVPGLYVFFYLLRYLVDAARENDFHLIGCVESASSTEYSKLYLPYQAKSFYSSYPDRFQKLKDLSELYSSKINKTNITEEFRMFLKISGWDDEKIGAFALEYDDESLTDSEFTTPLPVRRYFSGSANEAIFDTFFGSTSSWNMSQMPALEEMFNQMIDEIFSFEEYRILMSYVRTSSVRTPARFEFAEHQDYQNWKKALAVSYITSLPYSDFGLPIFIYYVDKIVRMPSEVISRVTRTFLLEEAWKALGQLDISGIGLHKIINMVNEPFRRDYYTRE